MSHDSYKTISAPVSSDLKEKGSKFIAQAYPVSSEQEAKDLIARINKEYFDATHNCFAYRIGDREDEIFRFNDDGEPSGTAGKPILQGITSHELTNLLVVVTRYFGGTKLGTGGLIRAYGGVTVQVLEKATVKMEYHTEILKIQYDYSLSDAVAKSVNRFDAQTINSDYSSHVIQQIRVRKSMLKEFSRYLIDISSGRVLILYP